RTSTSLLSRYSLPTRATPRNRSSPRITWSRPATPPPMPRTRTPSKAAAAALLLLLPIRSSFAASQPPPETLLDWALQPPQVDYRGRMMFTQWFGKQARAEDVEIYRSGERSRREFLAPDGTPSRVLISDGERQEVHLVKKGKVLKGDAVGSYEKVMPPEHE